MSNVIEFDDMLFSEEQWNANAKDNLDTVLLNQYPFIHDGMTVGEYFIEKKYYAENYKKVLDGNYTPLWTQQEK